MLSNYRTVSVVWLCALLGYALLEAFVLPDPYETAPSPDYWAHIKGLSPDGSLIVENVDTKPEDSLKLMRVDFVEQPDGTYTVDPKSRHIRYFRLPDGTLRKIELKPLPEDWVK